MGASKSKSILTATEEEHQVAIAQRDKRPAMVSVDRPKLGERRPVLDIPNSPYRVLYVDPHQRGDVVGKHGYIVVKTSRGRGWSANTAAAQEGVAEEGEELGIEPRRPSASSAGSSSRASSLIPAELPDGSEEPFGAFSVAKPRGTRPKAQSAVTDDLDLASDGAGAEEEEEQAAAEEEGGGEAAAEQDEEETTLKTGTLRTQQFVRPTGRMTQDFIYFQDRVFDDDAVGQLPEYKYEQEEDEIHDMVNAKRIQPQVFEPTEQDLTYELPSKILDALRMAIDAKPEDLRHDMAGQMSEEEAQMLKQFREAAMQQLLSERDPFEDQPELVIVAAPTIDHNMTAEDMDRKSKMRRKKQLHKEVTQFKKVFESANHRKPTHAELDADKDFGPTYREYVALKRELATPGDEDDDQLRAKTPEATTSSKSLMSTGSALPPPGKPDTATAAAPPTVTPTQPSLAPIAASSPGAALSPHDALRQHPQWLEIRRLAGFLLGWQEEFKFKNGHAANKADVMLDPDASTATMQLRRLTGGVEVTLTPAEVAAARDVTSYATATAAQQQAQQADQRPSTAALAKEAKEARARVESEETTERRNEAAEEVDRRRQLMRDFDSQMAEMATPWAKVDGAGAAGRPGSGGSSGLLTTQTLGGHAGAGGGEGEEFEAKVAKRGELLLWLSMWGGNFKDRAGRPPVRADVENDPMAWAKFEMLQGIVAEVGGPNYDVPAVPQPGLSPAELVSRRKVLGKQLNAWKAAFERANGRKPNATDLSGDVAIAAIYAEYQLLPREVDAEQPAAVPPSPQTGGAARDEDIPTSRPTSSSLELKAVHKRRKQLGKELRAWKAEYMAANDGAHPSVEDMPPEIAEIHSDYQRLKQEEAALGGGQDGEGEEGPDGARLTTPGLRSRRRKSSARGTPDLPDGLSDVKAVHKRRKQLGKELNAWKAQFEATHGKKPTPEDIEQDPDTFAIYCEYRELKATEAAINGETGGDGEGGQGDDMGGSRSRSNSRAGLSIDPGATEAEMKLVKKRRKALAKELNLWKQAFMDRNDGAKPREVDLQEDEHIYAIFLEHEQLRQREKELSGQTLPSAADEEPEDGPQTSELVPETTAAPAPPASDAGTAETAAALQKRRKQLGKELNAWKQRFTELNGQAPTAADIAADAEMAARFQEYMDLPRAGGGGGDAAAGDAGGGAEEAAVDSSKRRKLLAKQLNHWKALFVEREGRDPKTEDILDDPEIAPIYEEFLSIRKD